MKTLNLTLLLSLIALSGCGGHPIPAQCNLLASEHIKLYGAPERIDSTTDEDGIVRSRTHVYATTKGFNVTWSDDLDYTDGRGGCDKSIEVVDRATFCTFDIGGDGAAATPSC